MTAASANISAAVPAVAAQLDGAYTNYTAVRPCMVDLNARIQSINDTVVVLPANISVRPCSSHIRMCSQAMQYG